jgi:hypothetical protein
MTQDPGKGAGLIRPVLIAVVAAVLLMLLITRWPRPEQAFAKIGFSLSGLDEEGLHGPVDGRRARDYEFCIPDTPAARADVLAIDSTVQLSQAPGRVACRDGEALAIGHTHQPNWRDVLLDVARLDYVRRIEPHHAE